MKRPLQLGILVSLLIIPISLTGFINNKASYTQPTASKNTMHASFSPGKDAFLCEIADIPHRTNMHPGDTVTLKAGISGGSGTYSIKWKAQDKQFDTSAVDAEGLGTFADSGTPLSVTNPTEWFAPSAFRDTTQIEIRLFVTDKQRDDTKTSCAIMYAVGDTEALPTPTLIPTGASVRITMPVLESH